MNSFSAGQSRNWLCTWSAASKKLAPGTNRDNGILECVNPPGIE